MLYSLTQLKIRQGFICDAHSLVFDESFRLTLFSCNSTKKRTFSSHVLQIFGHIGLNGQQVFIDSTMSSVDDINHPISPLESDCCGDGCNPCIFDVHRELVEKWERSRNLNETVRARMNLLSLTKYKSFVISELKQACANCILIRLNYGGAPDADAKLFLSPGQHVILRSSTLSRPYTPISWKADSILLLVKIYPNGKFSKSLERMKVGDEIDVRGAYGNFLYEQNSFEEILMLSVGTGIAALYPIARSLIDNELEETRVHLISGFKSYAHIPLENELRDLSHYWNFSCTIRLSQKNSENRMNGVRLESGQVDKETITSFLETRSPVSTLVLICGTPEFNDTATRWISDLNFTNFHVFD